MSDKLWIHTMIKKTLFIILFLVTFCSIHYVHATISDPVEHWNFDEGSGTSAADSVAGNTATLTGAVSPGWIAGKIGPFAVYNPVNNAGSGSGIVASSISADQIGDKITVSVWVQASTTMNNLPIVNKFNSANNWFLGWNTVSNTILWAIRNNACNANISSASASTYNDGNWHMVTGTFDATGDGKTRLYIDGNVEIVTSSGSETTGICAPLTDPVVMGQYKSTGNASAMDIDDVCIYHRALSASEVLSLYNSSVGCTSSGVSIPRLIIWAQMRFFGKVIIW